MADNQFNPYPFPGDSNWHGFNAFDYKPWRTNPRTQAQPQAQPQQARSSGAILSGRNKETYDALKAMPQDQLSDFQKHWLGWRDSQGQGNTGGFGTYIANGGWSKPKPQQVKYNPPPLPQSYVDRMAAEKANANKDDEVDTSAMYNGDDEDDGDRNPGGDSTWSAEQAAYDEAIANGWTPEKQSAYDAAVANGWSEEKQNAYDEAVNSGWTPEAQAEYDSWIANGGTDATPNPGEYTQEDYDKQAEYDKYLQRKKYQSVNDNDPVQWIASWLSGGDFSGPQHR